MLISISSGKHTSSCIFLNKHNNSNSLYYAWPLYLKIRAECRQHHLVARKGNPLCQQHHIGEFFSCYHPLQLPEQK